MSHTLNVLITGGDWYERVLRDHNVDAEYAYLIYVAIVAFGHFRLAFHTDWEEDGNEGRPPIPSHRYQREIDTFRAREQP